MRTHRRRAANARPPRKLTPNLGVERIEERSAPNGPFGLGAGELLGGPFLFPQFNLWQIKRFFRKSRPKLTGCSFRERGLGDLVAPG